MAAGEAKIVPELNTEADARVQMTPRHPGVSRKVVQVDPKTLAKVEEPQEAVYESTHATRIFDPTQAPKETVEDEAGLPTGSPGELSKDLLNLPDWLKEVKFEESDGVDAEAVKGLHKFKSVKDVAKSVLHAEKQIGKLASEKTGLARQVEDLLKRPTAPEVQAATAEETQKSLKAISENFLDDIPGNITKLVETVQKMTAAQAQGTINRLGESVEAGQVEALFLGYPGLVNNAEEAAKIDELASQSKAKTTLGKYKQALSEYAKEKGYASGEAYSKPVNLEPAPKTAPVTRTATTKKVYNRAWLQQQSVNNQNWYRANQAEIMAAYAEGRVR